MYILKDIIRELERIAPPQLAESWDNVGLMLGSRTQAIQRVLCALDINQKVVEEAIQMKVQCIITHHPFIFQPLKELDFDTSMGKLIQMLILHGIAVYSMHTNYDIAEGGTNDILCKKLGVQQTKVLSVTHKIYLCKLAIYVPQEAADQVRQVMIAYNQCTLGNYIGCTFTTEGEGTFVPLEGSNPYIGHNYQLEKVSEKKIECLCNQADIPGLMEAIQKVHPYEEIAYDAWRLENCAQVYGIGRYGVLEHNISFEEYIEHIKQVFGIKYIRTTAKKLEAVRRIAVCSGSGASYIKEASRVADIYITGDLKFHEAQQAQALGLCVIDVGHYASENIAMQVLSYQLEQRLKPLEVILSSIDGETLYTL